MKPTVGRIVLHHHLVPGHEQRLESHAALITKVTEPDARSLNFSRSEESRHRVSLRVFTEQGDFAAFDVPFEETAVAGHWSWPQKVGT